VHFFAEDLVDEPVKIRIMRKNDVSALIPHKTVLIYMGSGVAADAVGFLVQNPVIVTQFMETVGRTQSGRSCSDNDNFLARHRIESWDGMVFEAGQGLANSLTTSIS